MASRSSAAASASGESRGWKIRQFSPSRRYSAASVGSRDRHRCPSARRRGIRRPQRMPPFAPIIDRGRDEGSRYLGSAEGGEHRPARQRLHGASPPTESLFGIHHVEAAPAGVPRELRFADPRRRTLPERPEHLDVHAGETAPDDLREELGKPCRPRLLTASTRIEPQVDPRRLGDRPRVRRRARTAPRRTCTCGRRRGQRHPSNQRPARDTQKRREPPTSSAHTEVRRYPCTSATSPPSPPRAARPAGEPKHNATEAQAGRKRPQTAPLSSICREFASVPTDAHRGSPKGGRPPRC